MMNMDTSKMSDEAWNVGGQNDPQMMSFRGILRSEDEVANAKAVPHIKANEAASPTAKQKDVIRHGSSNG